MNYDLDTLLDPTIGPRVREGQRLFFRRCTPATARTTEATTATAAEKDAVGEGPGKRVHSWSVIHCPGCEPYVFPRDAMHLALSR